MNWQPIETAPADTYVLVWCEWIKKARVGVRQTVRRGVSGPGWRIAYTPHDNNVRLRVEKPTHWMPLPDPPSLTSNPKGE